MKSNIYKTLGLKTLSGLITFLGLSAQLDAAVVFYTDKLLWEAAVSGIETLTTNAAGVGTADEVAGSPSPNALLRETLTFAAANSGLTRSFTVKTLEPARAGEEATSGFTFEDNEGGSEYLNALSVGDINNYEDDDWQLTLTAGPVATAFAFLLVDNHNPSTDQFSVYAGNDLLGSTTAPGLIGGRQFFGFVSSVPFTRVVYDDDATGDDIAIATFSFAIPEPSGLLLISFSFAGLLSRRNRRTPREE